MCKEEERRMNVPEIFLEVSGQFGDCQDNNPLISFGVFFKVFISFPKADRQRDERDTKPQTLVEFYFNQAYVIPLHCLN